MFIVEIFDTDEDAIVDVAKGIQWWNPGCPIFCKLLKRGNTDAVVDTGHVLARAVAVHVHDRAHLIFLFDDTFPQPRRMSYSSLHVSPRLQAPKEPVAMTAGSERALPLVASVGLTDAKLK